MRSCSTSTASSSKHRRQSASPTPSAGRTRNSAGPVRRRRRFRNSWAATSSRSRPLSGPRYQGGRVLCPGRSRDGSSPTRGSGTRVAIRVRRHRRGAVARAPPRHRQRQSPDRRLDAARPVRAPVAVRDRLRLPPDSRRAGPTQARPDEHRAAMDTLEADAALYVAIEPSTSGRPTTRASIRCCSPGPERSHPKRTWTRPTASRRCRGFRRSSSERADGGSGVSRRRVATRYSSCPDTGERIGRLRGREPNAWRPSKPSCRRFSAPSPSSIPGNSDCSRASSSGCSTGTAIVGLRSRSSPRSICWRSVSCPGPRGD